MALFHSNCCQSFDKSYAYEANEPTSNHQPNVTRQRWSWLFFFYMFLLSLFVVFNFISITTAARNQNGFQLRRAEERVSAARDTQRDHWSNSRLFAENNKQLASLRAAPSTRQYLSGASSILDMHSLDNWRNQRLFSLSSPSSSSFARQALTNEKHSQQTLTSIPFSESSVKDKNTKNFSCNNLNLAFYADKNSDCRLYWYCNERGQVQDVFECPHRLAFDEATRECKPASTFECSSIVSIMSSSPPSSTTGLISETNQFVLLHGLSSKNGDKSSALLQPTEPARRSPIAPSSCSDATRGFSVIAGTGCRKYIYCSMSNQRLEFDCPAGTLFNPVSEACESAREFTCPLKDSTESGGFLAGDFRSPLTFSSWSDTVHTIRLPTMSTGIFICQPEDGGRNFSNTMDHCVTYWSCLSRPAATPTSVATNGGPQHDVAQKLQVCPPEQYHSNRQQKCTEILTTDEAQACEIPLSTFEARLYAMQQKQQKIRDSVTSVANVTDFCRDRQRGLWPDPTNGCHVYYYCTAGGSKSYQFSCPDDLIFVARTQACETPSTRLRHECAAEVLSTPKNLASPALLQMNLTNHTSTQPDHFLMAASSDVVFNDMSPSPYNQHISSKYRSSQRQYNSVHFLDQNRQVLNTDSSFGTRNTKISDSKTETQPLTSTLSYAQLNEPASKSSISDRLSTSNGLVPDRTADVIIIDPQKMLEMQNAISTPDPKSTQAALPTNHRICLSGNRTGYAIESGTACRAYWECNGPDIASRRYVCPEGYAFDVDDSKRCVPSDMLVCNHGISSTGIDNAHLAGVATENMGRSKAKAVKSWERYDCRHKNGYYADYALGCQIFYFCHLNATKLTLACPQIMMFDENAQTCVAYPSSDGGSGQQSICTNPPLPKLLISTQKTSYKLAGAPAKQLKKHNKLQCPQNVRGYFADPGYGCRRYWYCSAGGRKEDYYDCPGVLLFNASTGACDTASSVMCADPLMLDSMYPGFLRRIQNGSGQAQILSNQWNNENDYFSHPSGNNQPQRFSSYKPSISNNMILQPNSPAVSSHPGTNYQTQLSPSAVSGSLPLQQIQQYFRPEQRHLSSSMMSPSPQSSRIGNHFPPQMELGGGGLGTGLPLSPQLASILANSPVAGSSLLSRTSLPMGSINQHHLQSMNAAGLGVSAVNPFAEMFGLIAKCEPKQTNGFFSDPESGCRNFYYCDMKGNRVNNFSCPHHLLFNEKLTQCQKPVDALSFCATLVNTKKGVPAATPAPEKEIEAPEAEGGLLPVVAPAAAASSTHSAANTAASGGAGTGHSHSVTAGATAGTVTNVGSAGTPHIANILTAPVCRGRTGYVADVDSACSQYFFCFPNGTAISHTCPAAMIFSEQASHCDWRSRVSHCGVSGMVAHPYITSPPTGSPYELLPPMLSPSQFLNGNNNMPLYDASGSTLSFTVAHPSSSPQFSHQKQTSAAAEVPYYNTNPSSLGPDGTYMGYAAELSPGSSGGTPRDTHLNNNGPGMSSTQHDPSAPAISALEGITLSTPNAYQNTHVGTLDVNANGYTNPNPLSAIDPNKQYTHHNPSLPPNLQNSAVPASAPGSSAAPVAQYPKHQQVPGEGLVLPPQAKNNANSQLPDSATPPSTQEQEAVDFEGPAAAGGGGGGGTNHNMNLISPATRGAASLSGRVVLGSVGSTSDVSAQNAQKSIANGPPTQVSVPKTRWRNEKFMSNQRGVLSSTNAGAMLSTSNQPLNDVFEPLYGPYSSSVHLPEPLGPDMFGGPNSADTFLTSSTPSLSPSTNPKTFERLRLIPEITVENSNPSAASTLGGTSSQSNTPPKHNPPPFSSSSFTRHQQQQLSPQGVGLFFEPATVTKRHAQRQPLTASNVFISPLPVHVRPDFHLHSAPGPHNAPVLASLVNSIPVQPQDNTALQRFNRQPSTGEAVETIESELEGTAALLTAFRAMDTGHTSAAQQQPAPNVMLAPLLLDPRIAQTRSSANIDYRNARRHSFLVAPMIAAVQTIEQFS